MGSVKNNAIVAVLAVCLITLIILSLCIGNFSVSVSDLIDHLFRRISGDTYDTGLDAIIVNVRSLRIIAAVLIGAALAVSGLVYQTVFSNNMVSPDLLGVSSSAACGAAAAIVCGLPARASFISSFVFSVTAVFLTFLISKLLIRREDLLLAGIIVAGFAKSGLGLLKYFADPENGELESIVYWELGSLSKVSWDQLAVICPAIILIIAAIFLLRHRFSGLIFGENAQLLGIHVHIERMIAIALASMLVSLSTAVCGIVSWVSLIIPIASEELTGSGSLSDNIVVTAFLGAAFLLLADDAARAATTSEIPISILTGTAGLIVFCIAVFPKRGKQRV